MIGYKETKECKLETDPTKFCLVLTGFYLIKKTLLWRTFLDSERSAHEQSLSGTHVSVITDKASPLLGPWTHLSDIPSGWVHLCCICQFKSLNILCKPEIGGAGSGVALQGQPSRSCPITSHCTHTFNPNNKAAGWWLWKVQTRTYWSLCSRSTTLQQFRPK